MGDAMYSVDEERTPRHPLARGASPAAIRAALPPEDQVEFDRALGEAADELKAGLDLVPLFTVLDRWRRIAALQSDPERFARVVRRAAAVTPGQDPSDANAAAAEVQPGT